METFELKIPYTGEQISTFKTLSDLGSLVDSKSNSFNLVSDDEMNFFKSLTLGFFRLSLNGTCQLIDRDFENLVTIFNITSKDKGGKGKLDSVIRISLKDEHDKNIYCECEINRAGFIKRVDVDLEKIFSPILTKAINSALENVIAPVDSKNFVYEPLVSPCEVGMETSAVKELDIEALSSLVTSGNIRDSAGDKAPLWLQILQLPAHLLFYPIVAIRKFLLDI